MTRRLSPFRIFDPDHPGQPSIKTTSTMSGIPRTPTQSSRKTLTRQSVDQVHSSNAEALLDLHQQQLDAIHAATLLISNLLKNAPDVHTQRPD